MSKLLLIAAGLWIGQRKREGGNRGHPDGSFKGTVANWKRTNRRRKPPEAGMAAPAVSPNGPLPLKGGAEAPLEFD